MNPTDPTAAIEAAKRAKKFGPMSQLLGDSEGYNEIPLYSSDVMADFILANKDAILALPTPVTTAKTAAEAAGIVLPIALPVECGRPYTDQRAGRVRMIIDKAGRFVCLANEGRAEAIADALNAPAPAPVAPVNKTRVITPEESATMETVYVPPAPAAPVAREGGLFEGGDWVSTDVHSRALKPHAQHWFRCVKEGWKFDPKVGTFWGLHHYEGKPVNYTEIWCDRHGNPLAVPTPGAGDAGGEAPEGLAFNAEYGVWE